jgi:3-oxoacyl-[acyl-carrier protein] reductase
MEKAIAIVTGPSQGIGRATAVRLARDFSGVTLLARNSDYLIDTATEVKAPGADVGAINAAIVALAKAFADQGPKDGVQVNSELPGPIMTDRRKSFLAHWAQVHNVSVEAAGEGFFAQAGISRYGTPQDIADLMAFLVSPAARWLTGTALRIDGGEVSSI